MEYSFVLLYDTILSHSLKKEISSVHGVVCGSETAFYHFPVSKLKTKLIVPSRPCHLMGAKEQARFGKLRAQVCSSGIAIDSRCAPGR